MQRIKNMFSTFSSGSFLYEQLPKGKKLANKVLDYLKIDSAQTYAERERLAEHKERMKKTMLQKKEERAAVKKYKKEKKAREKEQKKLKIKEEKNAKKEMKAKKKMEAKERKDLEKKVTSPEDTELDGKQKRDAKQHEKEDAKQHEKEVKSLEKDENKLLANNIEVEKLNSTKEANSAEVEVKIDSIEEMNNDLEAINNDLEEIDNDLEDEMYRLVNALPEQDQEEVNELVVLRKETRKEAELTAEEKDILIKSKEDDDVTDKITEGKLETILKNKLNHGVKQELKNLNELKKLHQVEHDKLDKKIEAVEHELGRSNNSV